MEEIFPAPQTPPKKKHTALRVILIVLAVLVLAAGIAAFLVYRAAAPYRALAQTLSSGEFSLRAVGDAELDGEPIDFDILLQKKDTDEGSTMRLEFNDVPVYYVNGLLILENGKAYVPEFEAPDTGSLSEKLNPLGLKLALETRNGVGSLHLDSEELLSLIGEETGYSLESLDVVFYQESGTIVRVTADVVGALSDGRAFSVSAEFSEFSDTADFELPEAVAEAAVQSKDGLPVLDKRFLQLIGAVSDLSGSEELSGDVAVTLECGPLSFTLNGQLSEQTVNGKQYYRISRESLVLWTDGKGIVTEDGLGLTSEQTESAELASSLPGLTNTILSLWSQADLDRTISGDIAEYTVSLDSEALSSLMEDLAPQVAELSPTYTGGTVTLREEDGSLLSAAVSISGSVKVLIVDVPLTLTVELTFNDEPAPEVPEAVITALG